ncbi:MAG TPA: cache domain-containing protein [Xanthobacteraceae bacterium]|jgi:signal transduction histidine kinase|nr:cache domain-containing protein [Xanthobacteraceae bacterium]
MSMILPRLGRAALAAIAVLAAAPAFAGRTAEETKAFVEKAVAHLKEVGQEKAFVDFNPDGKYVDGELYIFCLAADGTTKAHGGNANLVGKNLLSLKDPDGFQVAVEIIKAGLEKGEAWVDYKWPNSTSKKVEIKATFVKKIDDKLVCGSGYYKG